MNATQQKQDMLRQFIAARESAPWVASWFEQYAEKDGLSLSPRACLQSIGGMASTWNEPHHIRGPWPLPDHLYKN